MKIRPRSVRNYSQIQEVKEQKKGRIRKAPKRHKNRDEIFDQAQTELEEGLGKKEQIQRDGLEQKKQKLFFSSSQNHKQVYRQFTDDINASQSQKDENKLAKGKDNIKLEQNQQEKDNESKVIVLLEQKFDCWFQQEMKVLNLSIKESEIQQNKRNFLKHLYAKIYPFLTNSEKKNNTSQAQKQSNYLHPHLQNRETLNQLQRRQIKQEPKLTNEAEFNQLNDNMVETIIKENNQIIRRQLRWQEAEQCPLNEKLSFQRKHQEIIASFFYEGYGMAHFKKYIVKKFLNKQKDWEILFPLVRDHEFYKRQSRPIVKQAFRSLEHFLKSKDAFPKETRGYVEIKETESKWYITPLLHCRNQFEPMVASIFLRMMGHFFNIQIQTEPDKKEIGITIKQAQCLYTNIIQKYYEKQRVAPENEMRDLQRYYDVISKKKGQPSKSNGNCNSKSNGNSQKQPSVPDRSMLPNKQLTRQTLKQKIETIDLLENTSLKDQLQALYIQHYLLNNSINQITQILSQCLKKPLKHNQTCCLHQSCIRKALQYTRAIQAKFLRSSFYQSQFVKTNPQPNPEFFIKTIGQNHNMKLLTWSREFDQVRKRIILIYFQKFDAEEEVIELWSLLEKGYKKFKENRQKGFLPLEKTNYFLSNQNSQQPVANNLNVHRSQPMRRENELLYTQELHNRNQKFEGNFEDSQFNIPLLQMRRNRDQNMFKKPQNVSQSQDHSQPDVWRINNDKLRYDNWQRKSNLDSISQNGFSGYQTPYIYNHPFGNEQYQVGRSMPYGFRYRNPKDSYFSSSTNNINHERQQFENMQPYYRSYPNKNQIKGGMYLQNFHNLSRPSPSPYFNDETQIYRRYPYHSSSDFLQNPHIHHQNGYNQVQSYQQYPSDVPPQNNFTYG